MVDVKLILGDCLTIMPTLPQVDAIITDLPYGTTACAWDEVIPFAPMWAEVKRILKPRGVFVTTASQPFTSKLVMSNLEWFKYEWVWEKNRASDFINANYRPMKQHENIEVFSDGDAAPGCINPMAYNPQGFVRKAIRKYKDSNLGIGRDRASQHGNYTSKGENFPISILRFGIDNDVEHPTQKPVALYEYLILTYTNPGDTVLDISAGSGTTGVAAILTGRNAILIEKDAGYFEVMQRRIAQAQMQPNLFEAQP